MCKYSHGVRSVRAAGGERRGRTVRCWLGAARGRPAAPLLSFYREIYRNEKIDTSFYSFSVKVCIVLILFILPFINYVLFGCSSKYAHSGISCVPVLGRKYLAAKSI